MGRLTWDPVGNLISRTDYLTSQTETYSYYFLGRLVDATDAYTAHYTYDEIGNILSMNGYSYN